ncbi:hypothetical protein [Oceanisphaera arctica]|uniref:Uncharacterized protein n=1 Tax=Oceanisphaera arctica TaxID=641510 RepID=A0A2P5TK05_9GAMM|nr:hypothetical protein [Oceanisphaera arctica]PPL15421.1 hypothetical protein UN63_12555 [Oceanisphaera arctica]GHA22528.1 hypothetical protein GCM10007082_24020 [Oceanisphaera arctica]
MTHTTNLKRLFTTLLVSATIGMAALPAQAQTQNQQVSPATLASKGDGVDHRQCKEFRRADASLPGYCFSSI